MTRTRCYLEIFLISFAALLLEISYTRVFSFKLSSYFTYLIIGFAMLGMGSGGVLVAISERLRGVAYDRLLPLLSLVGSVTIGLGYFVIVVVEVSTHQPPSTVGEILRLTLLCFALFAGFLVIGVMIARIFTLAIDRFNRLYFADLSGAALGCAAAVPLMLSLSPPGCVFVAAAMVAASGLRLSRGSRGLRAGLVMLVVAFGSISFAHDSLPDPVVDPVKSMGRENIEGWGLTNVFRQWHPIFRVDDPAAQGALVELGDRRAVRDCRDQRQAEDSLRTGAPGRQSLRAVGCDQPVGDEPSQALRALRL